MTKRVLVTIDSDPETSYSAMVRREGDQIDLDGAPCGIATVFNTDTIVVEGQFEHSGVAGTLILDLSGGSFAPGFTDEPGDSDEIEVETRLGNFDEAGVVMIIGTPDSDHIVVGWDGSTVGVNLNADENDGVDEDVTLDGDGVLIKAGDGDDLISGRGGYGTGMPGGGPYVYGETGADTLLGGRYDSLYGGDGDDTLKGGTELFGGPGDDLLVGTNQLNILLGGPGDDVLRGKGGEDTAGYGDALAGVTVDLKLNGPQDTVGAGVDALSDIEDLLGSPFDDVLRGDEGPNRIWEDLNVADDVVGGNDRLIGRGGDDHLTAGGGNDVLKGGRGDDLLDRQRQTLAGNEILLGGPGDDRIEAGRRNDTLRGGRGADVLLGGSGNDRLYGEEGRDLLRGKLGDDRLDGGPDEDVCDGGSGSNVLRHCESQGPAR